MLYFLTFSVALNLLIYFVAYLLQTDKLTDISYSASFLIIVLAAYYFSGRDDVDFIFLLLIILWAIRLGSYLFYRILKIGYDDRFDDIRSKPMSFLGFWIMQGLTCAIVSFSYILSMLSAPKEMGAVFIAGIIIAFFGLSFESIADYQKYKFKSKRPRSFMDRGLWKIIRHPNYTGELIFWWGVFIASTPYTNLVLSVLAPLWISLIIIKFSGIPILDKKWQKIYGGDQNFQKYRENSWRLIPYIY
jgi:steroid 5-alpha reductase family enzyme